MINAKLFRGLKSCSHWRGYLIVVILVLPASHVHAGVDQGKRIYLENCTPCHGQSGKGDGEGARSLPVRPADHTDGALMGSRSDAFLHDVIAKGGSAMGLSSFMPAWQGIFSEPEIEDLVAYIRTLALPRK